MKSKWIMVLALVAITALAPGIAVGADLFTDTFEDFTLGQVADQGKWVSYSGAENSNVVDTTAYSGEQALDMVFQTYSARRGRDFGQIMVDGPNNTVSYYFRMGGVFGDPGDAWMRFYWEGEIAYPNVPTLIQTQVYSNRGLYYVDPSTGGVVNTTKVIADDTWYKFNYVYNPAAGTMRWMVDPAAGGANILDLTIGAPTGVRGIFELSWTTTRYPNSGFHTYIDDLSVSVVPEPSSMLALAVGLAPLGGALVRRRRR